MMESCHREYGVTVYVTVCVTAAYLIALKVYLVVFVARDDNGGEL